MEKLPHHLGKKTRFTESPENLDTTSEGSSAAMNMAVLGTGCTRQPASHCHSETKSIQLPPNQSVLQSVSPERVESRGKGDLNQLDVDTIEIRDSQQMVTEELGASLNAAYLAQPTEFKSTVKMVLYPPNGRSGTRIGKLDTGSRVNIISQKVMDTLGIKMEPYEGPDLTPIGPNIKPLGSIKLDWHITNFKKTYTTTFVVLHTSLSEGFDILLSEETIKEVGFYKVNDDVFFLKLAE